jgi:hypothetical protein
MALTMPLKPQFNLVHMEEEKGWHLPLGAQVYAEAEMT